MFFQIYRKEVVFLFLNQKTVVGAQNDCLIEVVLLSTQNICLESLDRYKRL